MLNIITEEPKNITNFAHRASPRYVTIDESASRRRGGPRWDYSDKTK